MPLRKMARQAAEDVKRMTSISNSQEPRRHNIAYHSASYPLPWYLHDWPLLLLSSANGRLRTPGSDACWPCHDPAGCRFAKDAPLPPCGPTADPGAGWGVALNFDMGGENDKDIDGMMNASGEQEHIYIHVHRRLPIDSGTVSGTIVTSSYR